MHPQRPQLHEGQHPQCHQPHDVSHLPHHIRQYLITSNHGPQSAPPAPPGSTLHTVSHKILPAFFMILFFVTGTVVLIYSIPLHRAIPQTLTIVFAILFGIIIVLTLFTRLAIYYEARWKRHSHEYAEHPPESNGHKGNRCVDRLMQFLGDYGKKSLAYEEFYSRREQRQASKKRDIESPVMRIYSDSERQRRGLSFGPVTPSESWTSQKSITNSTEIGSLRGEIGRDGISNQVIWTRDEVRIAAHAEAQQRSYMVPGSALSQQPGTLPGQSKVGQERTSKPPFQLVIPNTNNRTAEQLVTTEAPASDQQCCKSVNKDEMLFPRSLHNSAIVQSPQIQQTRNIHRVSRLSQECRYSVRGNIIEEVSEIYQRDTKDEYYGPARASVGDKRMDQPSKAQLQSQRDVV
jgi:hypothetical protein